jgi:hypothetical protein
MIISIINHAYNEISDDELQEAIRCINRQIQEDFEPYWGFGGKLRLEGRSGQQPSSDNPIDMRGDAIIYMWDTLDVKGAAGNHKRYYSGIPYGTVFTKICSELNENWTIALSHEALELLADPYLNLLAIGPHPHPLENKRLVFHSFEMCDAVQADAYKIEDTEVSNFVLPLYFTYDKEKGVDEPGSRNDFLGTKDKETGKTLTSFGVNPGGYVVIWDPEQKIWYTYTADKKAEIRKEIKAQAGEVRRAVRYQQNILL